ncbi:hypothetical protein [Salinispora sp. H7-4]|uniref:biotin synthase auxiliary protein BsaP n=1 Tax=Salinispora sp. H7-4 TaxID=2748321 RepID=UPI0015D27B62|nr:hypothetical protein [Salinispora sp. H7-4]NYT96383.1 hypothetical protein [Salinispora sp. H7-4]
MSSDTTGPAPLGTSTRFGGPAGAGASWCDRCGTPAGEGDHTACQAARQLEPPRYCGHCRRRMKVQVLPVGWAAVCVEHGETQA